MRYVDPLDADVLLADGSVAVVRGMLPGDHAGLAALHAGASLASLRLRFFAVGRKAGHDYVDHLFDPAQPTVASLVVTVRDRIVALGTAEPVSADTAEVAFLVDEERHGHGLGSLLLEHLAAACRDRGIRRFVAEVLTENRAMIGCLPRRRFRGHPRGGRRDASASRWASRRPRAPSPRPTPARTVPRRGRSSPLLHPRSVAVTGVRRDGTGIGAAVLGSIRAGGYAGVAARRPPQRRRSWPGWRSSARFVDLPEHVDLAIVAVPAARVLDALRDAAAAGVPTAVVDLVRLRGDGRRGSRAAARACCDLARAHSMRLVGPNCLGIMSNDPDDPAERDVQPRGAASGRPGDRLAVRRGRHRPARHRPRPRAGGRLLRLAGQQGGRLRQRPARRLARRPTRSPPPRCTWSRSATPRSSPGSPAASPSASRSSPSSAAARPAAGGPAPRTPPRRQRRAWASTRCSRRPG